jgi:hypothetical protein
MRLFINVILGLDPGIQGKPEGQGPTCLHVGECRDSEMRW